MSIAASTMHLAEPSLLAMLATDCPKDEIACNFQPKGVNIS